MKALAVDVTSAVPDIFVPVILLNEAVVPVMIPTPNELKNSGFKTVRFWNIAVVPDIFVPVIFVEFKVVTVSRGVIIDVNAFKVEITSVVPDILVPVILTALIVAIVAKGEVKDVVLVNICAFIFIPVINVPVMFVNIALLPVITPTPRVVKNSGLITFKFSKTAVVPDILFPVKFVNTAAVPVIIDVAIESILANVPVILGEIINGAFNVPLGFMITAEFLIILPVVPL